MSIVCPATVSNGTAWDAGIEKALAAGRVQASANTFQRSAQATDLRKLRPGTWTSESRVRVWNDFVCQHTGFT